jgi:aryl-alcohol dehydrogenase-like predicted oxidoreductase
MGQPITDADRKINEQIEKLATQHVVSMATVAIAWSLSKPFITATILGLSKKERVDEEVQALSLFLAKK